MICRKISLCYNAKRKSSHYNECPNNPSKCVEKEGRISNIKCEENGKVYVLENSNKDFFVSYKMDGGVIVEDKLVPNGTNKCDYLYVICDKDAPITIMVELKGVSVKKAVIQMLGTIDLYEDFLSKCSNVYCRIVVSSSTPQLKADPSYINLAKKIKIKYNGNIKIHERRFEEKYSELA